MRRPHPHLAIALVCAAIVLLTVTALACPARGEEVRVVPAPVREPGPAPAPTPTPDTVPVVNGWAIWPGSPECPIVGPVRYVPTQERVREITDAVHAVVSRELDLGVVGLGGISTPLPYDVWLMALNAVRDNAPIFTARPVWTEAKLPPTWESNCVHDDGTPGWCGCASGVGHLHPIVALDNPSRVEALVSWEAINARLCLVQRCDLADSEYVGTLNGWVRERVGGWRTE